MVGKGTWHEVQVRVQTVGTASVLQIWYHGTKIVDTTTALGTTEAGCVQIGEDGSGRSYDVRFDDVAVDTVFIPYAGPAAAEVTAAGADATPTPIPSPSPTPSPTAIPTPTQVPNATPVADAGPNQVVTDADLNGGELVTLDGGASYDGDGSLSAYEWETADGQVIASDLVAQVWLPVGRQTLRLVVTDDDGARDADKVVVAVEVGNATPVADAGPDATATDADGDGGEVVILDGTASYDPDGTGLAYVWSVAGQVVATDAVATVTLPVGHWDVVLTVTDAAGATTEDTAVVTVDAAVAPEPTPTSEAEADPDAADAPDEGGDTQTDLTN